MVTPIYYLSSSFPCCLYFHQMISKNLSTTTNATPQPAELLLGAKNHTNEHLHRWIRADNKNNSYLHGAMTSVLKSGRARFILEYNLSKSFPSSHFVDCNVNRWLLDASCTHSCPFCRSTWTSIAPFFSYSLLTALTCKTKSKCHCSIQYQFSTLNMFWISNLSNFSHLLHLPWDFCCIKTW